MSDEVELSDTPKVCRIAIIGGGPVFDDGVSVATAVLPAV